MTIDWTISQLDVKPAEGDLSDVVVTAHWRCTATEETFHGAVYSTCSFPAPEGEFTPYADLTLEQVLGWLWANGVDKDATESAVAAQIAAQQNPPIIHPPLPWNAAK
jgi:hypothetical protein